MTRVGVAVLLSAAGALACALGSGCSSELAGESSPDGQQHDPPGKPVPGPRGDGGRDDSPTGDRTASGPVDDPATCVWEGPPAVDVKTLPNCGTGASCMPSALIPKEAKGILAECKGGGTCVPNIFVESGGKFVLPSCHSLYEAEGRCLTTAIPLVKAAADSVPQDKCKEGERCLPCYSPFDGKETGLCGLSCDHAAEKPKLAPRCCSRQGQDRGVCVPKTVLAGAGGGGLADGLLEEAECSKAAPDTYVCVPQEVTQLDKAPVSCTASLPLVGKYQGVCLSDCFAGIVSALIGKGDCADPVSKCAPCTNPLDGTPTGLPGCPGADGGPFPGGKADAGAPK